MIILRTYEQRGFARKDYEGLTEEQKKILKANRDYIARHKYSWIKPLKDQWLEGDIKFRTQMLRDELSGKRKTHYYIDEYGTEENLRKTMFKEGKQNLIDMVKREAKRVRDGVLSGDNDKLYIKREKALGIRPSDTLNTQTTEKLSKKGFKLGKGGKIALGAGAALVGGTLAYKHYKNKNKR